MKDTNWTPEQAHYFWSGFYAAILIGFLSACAIMTIYALYILLKN